MSITSQSVTLHANGWTPSSNNFDWESQSVKYYPTSSSWSYYSPYPTSWWPVAGGNLGSQHYVVIKRNPTGETWSFTHNNYVEVN